MYGMSEKNSYKRKLIAANLMWIDLGETIQLISTRLDWCKTRIDHLNKFAVGLAADQSTDWQFWRQHAHSNKWN